MLSLLSLALVLLLPTTAAVVALGDDRAAADLNLARGLACGLSAWLVGSGVLAGTVRLSAGTAWGYDALVALVSTAVLGMPRHRARLASALRPALARLGASAGLGAAVFSPVLVVVLRTSWAPLGSTPWYYLGLAQQVAAAGMVPRSSVEFATRAPFLDDYHLFTTGTAMLLVQQPGRPVQVITVVTLLSVLLLSCGAVAVATALGAGPVTSLLTVPVALGTGVGMMRLDAYRPEGFALGLVLIVLALAVDWFRPRTWASVVTAAALLATLSQVHGIAATTAGVAVAAAGAAQVLAGPRREQLTRLGVALVLCSGGVVALGLAGRGISGTTQTGRLFDVSGLADPTWAFYRAGRPSLPLLPPPNGQLLYDVPGYLYGRSWWWVVPCLVLAAVGLWRRRRDPESRRVVAVTILGLVGVAVAGSVFMLGWASYVPRRTGASRIPLEASLLVPSFVALGLGSLGGARRRAQFLLALLVGCGFLSSLDVAGYDSSQALSRADLAAWRSLPVAPSDVILVNAYTEGFVPVATGARGLLDGRAPYTYGHLLHRANRLIGASQRFLGDPAGHWGFLRANHVSWVVVGTPSSWALSTGGGWSGPQALPALERCPGLRLVVDEAPRLAMFRVVDPGPGGC